MSRYLAALRGSFREHRVAHGLILLLAAAAIAWLIGGPRPWIEGVEPAEAAGEKLRPIHYVVDGLWWAAWGNLALALVMTASGPLLFRSLPIDTPAVPAVPLQRRGKVYLIIALSLAAVLSGVLQLPRLSRSLWGDEEYTTKRFVAGYYRRDKEGGMEHKMPEWVNTVWDYRSGANNHQLFSVLSRLTHSLHENSGDPDENYFSEELVRLPSFVASLGTVMAVGWLVALSGATRGALVAALFLAVHPWFLRYGPEARGYPLMMLWLTLSLIFLIKAAGGGRWRHWLLFCATEFLCFVSYMGSVHFIILLNVSGLLLVLFAQRERAARLPQFGRFVTANAIAAGLVGVAVAPVIAPLKAWYEKKVKAGVWGEPPDAAWIVDELNYLATGLPWKPWDASNPLSLHAEQLPRVPLVIFWCMLGVLVLAGVVWMVRGNVSWRRLILPALLLPGPLMVLEAVAMENFLFSWYLLITLPMVAVFVGLGAECVFARLRDRPKKIAVAGLGLVLCLLLVALTHERIHLLRSRSVEPLGEATALTRSVINPAHPDIDREVITVAFSMWTEAYDPAARFIHTAAELRAALNDARTSGRDLYVNFGQFLLAREMTPEIMAMIEDPAQFEEVEVLHGLWQPCTRWVYRAKLQPQQGTAQK